MEEFDCVKFGARRKHRLTEQRLVSLHPDQGNEQQACEDEKNAREQRQNRGYGSMSMAVHGFGVGIVEKEMVASGNFAGACNFAPADRVLGVWQGDCLGIVSCEASG